jgi:peptidoglycan hydrolase-like protein with peptidoglycan-binding domain
MQQRRRGRLRRPLVAAVALFALAVLAAPASGEITIGTITIPLPIAVPGLSSPPAQGAAPVTATKHKTKARAASNNPFASRGMWIWTLRGANGGSLSRIIAEARRFGISTLYIKSSDGSGMWSQFNSATVRALRAAGLKVCAWQFVYGAYPRYEAQAGANAVRDGANCLVIDAEGQYEGKYSQAQIYIARLRQLIGTTFPVALAGLPYVDYHPSFPYSVFLGPGGAQYNMPQMYWRDIGTSVAGVYAHTYLYNRIYLRPIYPLGQVYNSPPPAQLSRFRQYLQVYGAVGVSWWDWADATLNSWKAVSQYVPYLANTTAAPGEAALGKGAAGDLVVWAQEHLLAAGEKVAVDGGFGKQTLAAVEAFQLAHNLIVDGDIGSETWNALLQYKPSYVNWRKPQTAKIRRLAAAGKLTAADVVAGDTGSTHPGASTPPPASSLLPDRGHEIPPMTGAGRP